MALIGRNEPCPCGSGRKYKQCCLGKPAIPDTPAAREAQRLRSDEGELFERIFEWSRRRIPKEWTTRAIEEALLDEPLHEEDGHLYLHWLIYHHPFEGATIAARYAAEKGPGLSDADRRVLAITSAQWLSMWEVRDVRPDEGLELFDLLTHETRFVHEFIGSRQAQRWTLVLAYVADGDGVSILDGMHTRPLAPRELPEPLAEAKRLLRVRTRPAPIERVRDPEFQLALLQIWQEALIEREAAAHARPRLQNTDGDEFLMCTDHFDVSKGEGRGILAALAALDGADREDDSDPDSAVIFSRPGNRMNKSWPSTTIGRAALKGDRLEVETNSIQRADAVRARVEAALGDRVRYRTRTVADAQVAAARLPKQRGAAAGFDPDDPEIRAVIQQQLERHYRDWLDTELPALDGRTPRAAARAPASRRKLVALLKQFEVGERNKPESQRYDTGKLWTALGLDPSEG